MRNCKDCTCGPFPTLMCGYCESNPEKRVVVSPADPRMDAIRRGLNTAGKSGPKDRELYDFGRSKIAEKDAEISRLTADLDAERTRHRETSAQMIANANEIIRLKGELAEANTTIERFEKLDIMNKDAYIAVLEAALVSIGKELGCSDDDKAIVEKVREMQSALRDASDYKDFARQIVEAVGYVPPEDGRDGDTWFMGVVGVVERMKEELEEAQTYRDRLESDCRAHEQSIATIGIAAGAFADDIVPRAAGLHVGHLLKVVEETRAAREKAEKRVEELEDVIRPFAKVGGDAVGRKRHGWSGLADMKLSTSDWDRAAKALEGKE